MSRGRFGHEIDDNLGVGCGVTGEEGHGGGLVEHAELLAGHSQRLIEWGCQ